MSDNLKDHIDKQRDQFEIYSFDQEVGWNQISDKVKPVKKWPIWKLASVAACLLFVLTGSIYYANYETGGALSDVENYYESEINYKVSLVKSQLSDPSLLEDLEAMDQAFAELKADLKDNVDNEEVVTAMMENYQLKLRILEEILVELEKEKSESNL